MYDLQGLFLPTTCEVCIRISIKQNFIKQKLKFNWNYRNNRNLEFWYRQNLYDGMTNKKPKKFWLKEEESSYVFGLVGPSQDDIRTSSRTGEVTTHLDSWTLTGTVKQEILLHRLLSPEWKLQNTFVIYSKQ